MQDIIDTIQTIISSNEKTKQQYLNGDCLVFAEKLKKLCDGIILYLPEYKHFILLKNKKYYDASGNVTNQYKNSKTIQIDVLPDKILNMYRR